MRRNHPDIQFERYADDVICHCSSQRETKALHESLETQFSACNLMLHPEETMWSSAGIPIDVARWKGSSFNFWALPSVLALPRTAGAN